MPGFVVCHDVEGENLSLHSGDFGFCPYLHANRGGTGMLQIQGNAYGGFVFAEGFCDCFAGGGFHEGCHAGRGIDQQGTGANLQCGVLPFCQGGGFALHSNGNFHKNHNLSVVMIAHLQEGVNKKVDICRLWNYNSSIQ